MRYAAACIPSCCVACTPFACSLHANHVLVVPAARCAAARTSSSPQPGGPVGMAALCGASQMRAGRALETRPSPRPRPSAKPQARGSAPLLSSRTAAPQALGVSSTLSWCGASARRPYRRCLPRRAHDRHPRPACRRPCGDRGQLEKLWYGGNQSTQGTLLDIRT